MSAPHPLRIVLNLLLALALVAGPALALAAMPGQAAAVAEAAEPPCHGAPPPVDAACDSGCCDDGRCDPGACRAVPMLMVGVASALPPVLPARMRFELPASPLAAAPPGAMLRPPIA